MSHLRRIIQSKNLIESVMSKRLTKKKKLVRLFYMCVFIDLFATWARLKQTNKMRQSTKFHRLYLRYLVKQWSLRLVSNWLMSFCLKMVSKSLWILDVRTKKVKSSRGYNSEWNNFECRICSCILFLNRIQKFYLLVDMDWRHLNRIQEQVVHKSWFA